MEESDINDVDKTFCQRMKAIFSNKSFGLICMSLSGLYFVITGI